MPALQQEYDYYEYARRRQGTAKNVVSSGVVVKNNKVATPMKQPNNMYVNKGTTREITRRATRIATQDDSFINKNKQMTKNTKTKSSLNTITLANNKKNKKPQEITLIKPKNNKAKAEQKAKVNEAVKNIFAISIVFGILFLICYRYSTINESFKDLGTIKKELKNQKTINAQIESNIQQSTDLAYIENYAKYQLGMQKPKDSQIKKISFEKQDKILLPLEIVEEQEQSFASKLFSDLFKILD